MFYIYCTMLSIDDKYQKADSSWSSCDDTCSTWYTGVGGDGGSKSGRQCSNGDAVVCDWQQVQTELKLVGLGAQKLLPFVMKGPLEVSESCVCYLME